MPLQSTLLPQQEVSQDYPPIRLSLNPQSVQLLRQQALAHCEDSNFRPSISVTLADRAASLRLNDTEYQGTQSKETGHVEVFLPDRVDAFRSYGNISTNVSIKQDRAVQLPGGPDSVDAEHPHVQKIIQLLAIKPQTAAVVASKTNKSNSFVNSVLDRVAQITDQGVYELKPEYRPRKTPQASRSPSYDGRISPPDGTVSPGKALKSRLSSQTNASQRGSSYHRSSTSPSHGLSPPLSDESMHSISDENPNIQTRKRMSAHRDLKPASVYSRQGSTEPRPKRAKLEHEDEDLFEIARKFRDRYGEYRELYALLENRKSRPPKQLRRLLALHNQLTSWKEKLWSNARSKQVK